MCTFDFAAFDPVAFDTCAVTGEEDVCVDEWNLNNDLVLIPYQLPVGADPSGIGCAGEGNLNTPEKKIVSW